MPKCVECKFCIGYDSISKCYICSATDDIEFIEVSWAMDDELECDLYVNDSNDDTTA